MPTAKPTRLLSLDALRGFDMFWIAGGEEIVHHLAHAKGGSFWEAFAHQLSHPEWNGLTAYDLIFPLFLFLAGVSTPFSLANQIAKGADKSVLLKKIIRRGLILVLLGIIYNNGLEELKPLSEIRFASVLGRIGLAGMFAQIIYLYTNTRTQYIWFVALLIGYWAFIMLVPVPGCGAGLMTMACNPASYVDSLIIPGKLYKIIHDPEGLVSTIPAIGTALLGIFAGNLLRSDKTGIQKVQRLIIAGIGLLVVGYLWSLVFPLNKNLWTSSFVLVVGGYSALLLALFYGVIDVAGWNRWAWVLAVIGMNSILIYMASSFIDFGYTANAIFGWFIKLFSPEYQKAVHAAIFVFIEWLMLWFLYKKGVFLKV